MGALLTVKCWCHLVVVMDVSAMLPGRVGVVIFMIRIQGLGSMLTYNILGLALSLMVHARVSVEY